MRVIRGHIMLLICLLIRIPVYAGIPHHALIELYPESARQIAFLEQGRFDLIPGQSRDDRWMAALPEDVEYLQANGFRFEILIPDMEAHYARRARSEGHLDDMGGYKTFAEIEAAMDLIHSEHPDLTTEKFSIGSSVEGNPIWCMKLSDNPGIDEPELELLFTSAIHAREVITVELLFVFFDYLTDNYLPGSGNEATYLLENREFYWIPCVNPDGYLYNELTFPEGGGMWRKNRRDNGGGVFGVDLNRNWSIGWGFDDEGSSPDSSSISYRGPYAFSEPETDSLRLFIESRHFMAAINYHSYSNLVIYPWGTEQFMGGVTEDNDIFSFMADSMSYLIEQVYGVYYEPGTVWQALYYPTNGDANDWGYGQQTTKRKIFSFTIEVGSADDGFWPAPSRIDSLCLENLPANLFISRYAEALVPPDQAVRILNAEFQEFSGDGDGIMEAGEQIALSVTLKNNGDLDLFGITGQLQSNSPFAETTVSASIWNDAAVYDTVVNETPFLIDLDGGVPEPFGIELSLRITAFSGLDTTIILHAVIGPPLLSEDFETGAPAWTHEAGDGWYDQWHLSTERSVSGTTSYKCGDSGTGYYLDRLDARLISPVIEDLPDSSVLSFWSDIYAQQSGLYPDSAYDGGLIQISVDGGPFETIAPTAGYPYTFRWVETEITPHTGPMPGEPCFSGYLAWTKYEVDLSDFAGRSIQIRFRFGSDAYSHREGWYIDDVKVEGVRNVVVVQPQGLIARRSHSDLILSWEDDINQVYKIYSSSSADGPFETYEGSTTLNRFVIPNVFDTDDQQQTNGAISVSNRIGVVTQRFYVVKGALPPSR
ncbi:choice-of-anchor J domain-containing protein [bacterium]|nr:choice-of-anchor J domain-containing protein [bacterium]